MFDVYQTNIESVPTSLEKKFFLPSKHLGVLKNSLKRVRACQMELEFEKIYVGFWGEGKTGVPGEKPLEARERTKNQSDTTVHNHYNFIRL